MSVYDDDLPSSGIVGGLTLRGKWQSGEERWLPLRPIFPGFIINTLFYAAIWFGVFFGVGFVKRAIRKKRGRCVKCGYDLRGQRHQATEASRDQGHAVGCPECGWGRDDADL